MSFLRRCLLGNGVFSLLAGVITTVLAAPLSDYMGAPQTALYVIGVGTTLFAVAILFSTRRPDIHLGFALGVIGADLAWVVAALAIILIPETLTGEGKAILAAVSVVVGSFAALQTLGLVKATRESPKRITTEIEIAARPDQVWTVLTDLGEWHWWNPWIGEAAGTTEQGERLSLRMGADDGRKFSVKPLVTTSESGRALEWLGHLGVSGVFDGRHRFDLHPISAGTRLVQSEEFTGMMVPVLNGMLEGETRSGFEAMNMALKKRVEKEGAATSGS